MAPTGRAPTAGPTPSPPRRSTPGPSGERRDLPRQLRSVAGCPEPLPTPACDVLRLGEGATYSEAARVVTRRVLEGTLPAEDLDELDPVEDVDAFLAGIGPQDDRYTRTSPWRTSAGRS